MKGFSENPVGGTLRVLPSCFTSFPALISPFFSSSILNCFLLTDGPDVNCHQALGLANAFSGGVFLALAFGHMLPHAIEAFGAGGAETACALAFGGYMLVFFVEKIAFDTDGCLAPLPAKALAGAPSAGTGSSVGLGASLGAGRSAGAVLLLAALSVHSLLEFAALGVQSRARSASLLAASIGLHQPAESVALLVALLKAVSAALLCRFIWSTVSHPCDFSFWIGPLVSCTTACLRLT